MMRPKTRVEMRQHARTLIDGIYGAPTEQIQTRINRALRELLVDIYISGVNHANFQHFGTTSLRTVRRKRKQLEQRESR